MRVNRVVFFSVKEIPFCSLECQEKKFFIQICQFILECVFILTATNLSLSGVIVHCYVSDKIKILR